MRTEMRIGYVTITKELIESPIWMDFLPTFQQSFTETAREDLGRDMKLTGTCPLFDEIKEGEAIPQYTFIVVSKPTGGHEIKNVERV